MFGFNFAGPAGDEEHNEQFNLESYQPMSVVYQIRGSVLRRVKAGEPILPEVDGREETKADVIRALLSGAHPYLVSEEGTGKTRLARSLTSLLPRVPVISGCPYNDDPKWPREMLCPRCRASRDPVKEFGIDFLPGKNRFSRIQGNEYTNEVKLLGLKDIQAIAHGKSPSDPQVFTGTGVFKANRGILFIDELPAIRTKVQVLLHPILEEKKAILEEYNWEHPLDLIVIATGNPRGFSHVNEIPRPLLDRLEPVYMDLPDEEIEKEIMLKQSFRVLSSQDMSPESQEPPYPTLDEVARKVAAPWWIIDIVNKTVRYSRVCPYVEKKASIRATNRALDHTYASVEMENKRVANLRHAYYGARLALRGRIGLSAELIDFENPKKAFMTTDEMVGDFIWNVFEEIKSEPGFLGECDRQQLGAELSTLLFSGQADLLHNKVAMAVLSDFKVVNQAVQWMKQAAQGRMNYSLASEVERKLYDDEDMADECNYSALEVITNICVHEGTLTGLKTGPLFIAQKFRG